VKIQFQFSVKINFSHLYSFIYHMISAGACGRIISAPTELQKQLQSYARA